MLFILIGLIILFYACWNFKKSFFLFLLFKIFLVTNITVVSLPGIPLLTLELFMTISLFAIFVLKRKKLRYDHREFPFKIPFYWLIASWLLSTIFAYIGFGGAFSQFIKEVFLLPVTVWMMWIFISDKKDVSFLVKGFTWCFLIVCAYAFYEYSIQANPIVEYEMTLVDDENRAIDFTYDAETGRGYRVQSVFEHAIGAGINWGLFIIMICTLTFKYRFSIPNKKLAFVVLILCVPCILFTNSRGPILFFIIGCLAFLKLRNTRFYILLVLTVLLLFLFLPYFSSYFDNVISIFDVNAQQKVGGSNAEMRWLQLAAAIELFKQSPIVGLGFKFLNVMNNSSTAALLGMESIWFKVLTSFGLLGVIAHLVLCYYSIYKIPMKYKSAPIFFLSLAYWVTYTATSIPGVLSYFYYMLIIVCIKLSLLKKLNN